MRIAGTLLLVLALGVLSGCRKSEPVVDPTFNETPPIGGLQVGMKLPKTGFVTGETFNVVVTAKNVSDEPVTIDAASGSQVYVRIHRYTGMTWDEVKRYPETATMLMKPWTLQPGQQQSWKLMIPVEPDWPTAEGLRITAELNGRPEVSPVIAIEVLGSAKEK